jgi:hypothetical protein
VAAKPEAGSAAAASTSKSQAFDARTLHTACLHKAQVPFHDEQRGGHDGHPLILMIQVGTRPSGPTVVYQATPGAAQDVQIQGQAQGAEVIGSALVYPNRASDALLDKVEPCIAKGVTG